MAGELNNEFLEKLNKNLESMNKLLDGNTEAVGKLATGIENAFNSVATSYMNAARSIRQSQLIDAQTEIRSVQQIKDEIDRLKAAAKATDDNGTLLMSQAEIKATEEQIARLTALKKDMEKTSIDRAIELANIQRKNESEEEASLRKLMQMRNEYNAKIADYTRRINVDKVNSDGQGTAQGSFYKQQLDEYVKLSKTANDEIRKYRDRGVKLSIEEEKRLQLEMREQINRSLNANNGRGSLNKAWVAQTDRSVAAQELAKQQTDEMLKLNKRLETQYKNLAKARTEFENAQQSGVVGQELQDLSDKATRAEANIERTKKKMEQLRGEMVGTKEGAEALSRLKNEVSGIAAASQKAADVQKTAEKVILDYNKTLQRKKKLEHDIAIQEKTDAQVSASDKRKQQAELKELNRLLEEQRKKLRDLVQQDKQAVQQAAVNTKEQRLRRENDLLARQRKEYVRLNETMKGLLPTLQRLGTAFGIAFSVQGLVQFGKKLIETRGEFELQQVALRSILQNKQLADEIWDKTMQAALQSPFTAMQLTKYTKQLAAYRIETEKLFDTTKMLADVSAGLGVDMQRLILAYGQVKAANYLRASEIRQFTEAGVNILGELSTYLSETQGKLVSTADVMDMVQKRMVKFEAVEEIFHRMTEQGGIFYDMQYVQSQTVKGQINKLHDAYDQMLNNIGKANQGTMRDFVGLLNNIVKNWREWKTVLDLIAWPLIITSVYKFGRGLLYANASAITMRKSVNGLTRAGAKLQVMLSGLYKFIVTNPWLAAAAAIAAVATALYNHRKQVEADQALIEEQNVRLYETQQKMKDYQSAIESNNAAIKSNSLSTDELNQKKSENSKIIAELTRDYPDLVKGMKLEEDGTITLTDALKKYNDELERQMTLKNILSQNSGNGWLAELFSDTRSKNLVEYTEDLSKLKGELISVKAAANAAMMQMHMNKEEDLPFFAVLEEIKNLDMSDIEKAAERYREILSTFLYSDNDPYVPQTIEGIEGAFKYGTKLPELSTFEHDQPTAVKNLTEVSATLASLFDEAVSDFDEYAKQISDDYGDDVLDFIIHNTDKINEGVKNGNSDVVQTIRTILETNGGATTAEAKAWYNKMLNDLIVFGRNKAAIQEQIAREEDQKGGGDKNKIAQWKQDLLDLEELAKNYEPIDFFATPTSERTDSGTEDKKDKTKENASRLISLIKEMRSEYDKLAKSAYGYAKSEEEVRKSFHDSWEAILKEAGVREDYDFTTNEGEIAAMEKVRDYVKGNKKYAKDAWKEIQKDIDKLRTEIKIDAKLRDRDAFKREMEDMFGDYELSIELQDLNISEDAARRLFDDLDFSYVNIGNLRERMQEFYNLRMGQGEGFSAEDIKYLEQYEQKIEDILFKQRKEKAKEYSKFVKQELDERAKIELQYAKDVAFVMSSNAFTGDKESGQRKNLLDNLEKQHEQDLAELHWKSFRESDFYIEMMEDLSSIPSDYAAMLIEKLNEVINNPATDAKALKEAIKAREKVIDAQLSLRPMQGMVSSLGGARKAMEANGISGGIFGQPTQGTVKAFEQLILAKQKDIDLTEEEIALYSRVAGELKNYEDAQTALNNALIGTGFDASVKPEQIEASRQNLENLLAEEESQLHEGANLSKEEERENEQRRQTIKILRDQIQALIDLANAKRTVQGITLSSEAAEALASGTITTGEGENKKVHQVGKTSTDVQGKASEKKSALKELRAQIQELKNGKKNVEDFAKAWHNFNAQLGVVITKFGSLGATMFDTYEALGGETNALTEGWKEFGSTMIDVVTQALKMIPTLVTGFTAAGVAINSAMGIIGLIATAINLVLTAINAFAKLHDAGVSKEIEDHQKTLDELVKQYETLEKAVEKSMSSAEYVQNYDKAVQNLDDQIKEANAQLEAAEDYKNAEDKQNAIDEANDAIDEANEKLEEMRKNLQETFLGFSTDDFKSMTEDFVSAWMDAYEETGDGFDAMMDNFEEVMKKWFIKQAVMRVAGAKLESLLNDMVAAIDQNGDGGVAASREEIENIKEKAALIFAGLNDDLKELYSIWGLGGDDTLSGLAAGIQGMTEEQANVLEAYWNSVRQYAAETNSSVAQILNILTVNFNPMLQQVQLIAANTNDIKNLLETVAVNNGQGRGFRVYSM